jgi:hypothetical protein
MRYQLTALVVAAFGLKDVLHRIIVWGNTVVWGS